MEKLISLKKAAEISNYNPDYLGYLIRKGRLGGKRIGRDWFTTEEALKAYLLNKKFIPLREVLSIGSHLKLTLFLAFIIIAAIIIGVIWVFNPSVYFQRSPGDFKAKTQLQKAKIIIGREKNQKIKELEVTTYSSDENGGIEISVEPKQ